MLHLLLIVSQVGFDHLAKGESDAMVEEMIREAVGTIEAIAEDSWVE